MHNKFLAHFTILLFFFLIAAPILAQNPPFTFTEPAGWTVIDGADGSFWLTNDESDAGERMVMRIFSPDFDGNRTLGGQVDAIFNPFFGVDDDEQIMVEDITQLTYSRQDVELDGRTGWIQPLRITAEGENHSAQLDVFYAEIELDDDVTAHIRLWLTPEMFDDEVEAILLDTLASLSLEPTDEPESTENEEAEATTPQRLTQHAGDWREAIGELQELGVIGTGGSLVFNEPRAYYSGAVTRYTPLGRNSPYADIVMAAEMNFSTSADSELEVCSLFAGTQHINPGDPLNTFIQLAIFSDGTVVYNDMMDGECQVYGFITFGLDLNQPNHILFIIQDGIMTVYLNGQLYNDNIKVVDRAGAYGIALHGETSDAVCEGKNIWVYQAPVVTPGVCEVTASSAVNKRTGPGTNFDIGGQFEAGSIQFVTGQAEDSSGFIWWQLEDENWVREDVVSVTGDCGNVPQVSP